MLTRDDDTGVGPCVDERGRAGERAGADAVVSIHADGAGPGDRGFHVAYSDPPLNAVQRGPARTLAADLRDGLEHAGFPLSTYIGRDGLSPRIDLAGLNLATRPTALWSARTCATPPRRPWCRRRPAATGTRRRSRTGSSGSSTG